MARVQNDKTLFFDGLSEEQIEKEIRRICDISQDWYEVFERIQNEIGCKDPIVHVSEDSTGVLLKDGSLCRILVQAPNGEMVIL